MVIKVVTRGLVEFMIIEAKLAANKSSFRGLFEAFIKKSTFLVVQSKVPYSMTTISGPEGEIK